MNYQSSMSNGLYMGFEDMFKWTWVQFAIPAKYRQYILLAVTFETTSFTLGLREVIRYKLKIMIFAPNHDSAISLPLVHCGSIATHVLGQRLLHMPIT